MSFSRPTDRLFIGVFPDAGLSRDIAELGWHLRDVYRLTGRPTLPQRVHATLWHVYDGLLAPSPALIEELLQRLSGIAMRRFRVSLDHVMSFAGGALVLRGRDGVAGLEALHGQIKAALSGDTLNVASSAYTPHVTLLRDRRRVPLHELGSPIEWEVNDIVLVHSLLGRTVHRHVARLPLKPRDGH